MTGHIQDTTWPIIPATDQWAGPIPLQNWPTTGHTHGTTPGHNWPTPGGNTNNWPTPGTTHSWPTSTNIQTPTIKLTDERLPSGKGAKRRSFPGFPSTSITADGNLWSTVD